MTDDRCPEPRSQPAAGSEADPEPLQSGPAGGLGPAGGRIAASARQKRKWGKKIVQNSEKTPPKYQKWDYGGVFMKKSFIIM